MHSENGNYVCYLPLDGIPATDTAINTFRTWMNGALRMEMEKAIFLLICRSQHHIGRYKHPSNPFGKYYGVYDEGPDVPRKKPLQRLKKLGMMNEEVLKHLLVVDEVKKWDDLKSSARCPFGPWSGLPECIDHNVGRVISHIEYMGELERAFIGFLSENGAEIQRMKATRLCRDR